MQVTTHTAAAFARNMSFSSTHQDKVDKQKAPTVSSGGCSPSVAPYPSCHKAGTTRRSSSVWMLHIQRILPLNFDFMHIGLHCTGDVEKMTEYKTLANRPISTIQTSCTSSANNWRITMTSCPLILATWVLQPNSLTWKLTTNVSLETPESPFI